MKKYYGYIAFFYLGFSLTAFLNIGITDWRFYVIIIPMAILTTLDKYSR